MFNLRSFLACLSGGALVMGLASCGNNGQPGMTSPPQQAGTSPTTVTVNIPANAAGMGPQAFGTNPLVINAGDSVQWMNGDTVAHTATSDTGVFDTGNIAPGAMSSPIPFPSAGNFPYHCSIHGAASMSGVIQVNAASPSPSPSPSPTVSPSESPTPSPTVSPSPTESETPIPTSTKPKQSVDTGDDGYPVYYPGDGDNDGDDHHGGGGGW